MVHKLIQKIKNHYRKLLLPRISYASVMDNCNITLLETVDKPGGVTLEELAILIGICKKNNVKKVFEFGSFRGRTTVNIVHNCPDCFITTFDLPFDGVDESSLKYSLVEVDKPVAAHKHRGFFIQKYEEYSSRITCLFGDSATYDFTLYYNTFDMVFIDASHAYENVIIDSENAFKLLRNKKSVVVWHDYVVEHMDVVRAVHDIQKRHGLKIFHIKRTKFAYAEFR